MSDFVLSERIYNGTYSEISRVAVKDVKKFIRLLKEMLHDLHDEENCFDTDDYMWIIKQIDKLAGEEFIDGKPKVCDKCGQEIKDEKE